MFLVLIKLSFSSREDSEIILQKIRDIVYNDAPTTVVVSIKRRLPVHHASDTLQDITNDQIHLLDTCFDNVRLLEHSYDRKMGEILASKLTYTYTDPLENHIDKKGMKIISVQGHKEMVITYGLKIKILISSYQLQTGWLVHLELWDNRNCLVCAAATHLIN